LLVLMDIRAQEIILKVHKPNSNRPLAVKKKSWA